MKWSALLTFTLLLLPGAVSAHGAEYGGQSVEVQGNNLELVAEPETKGVHLHLYITDATEKIIANAQVKLQVTAPDSTKTLVVLTYDVKEKSYVTDLPMTVKGQYKVVALATLAGKKLNARYTFSL
jgi:hypothetical protein